MTYRVGMGPSYPENFGIERPQFDPDKHGFFLVNRNGIPSPGESEGPLTEPLKLRERREELEGDDLRRAQENDYRSHPYASMPTDYELAERARGGVDSDLHMRPRAEASSGVGSTEPEINDTLVSPEAGQLVGGGVLSAVASDGS